jgi:histidinol-phosphate aminotransferase
MKMYKFPESVNALTPYEPLMCDCPVRLDANESFIPAISDYSGILKDLKINRYPDPYAGNLLRKYAKLRNVSPEILTAGNGSDELICLIVSAFLSGGKKITAFSHDFSMYYFYPKLYGVNLEVLPKKQDLHIDFAKINDTDAVIFSNPCNPTSLAESRENITAEIKRRPDTLFIVDEAYMEFCGEGCSVLDLAGVLPNLIVLRTFSKALGAAALRLGIAAASPEITRKLRAVKSPYNVNTITQILGEYITDNFNPENIRTIIRSREFLQNEMEKVSAFDKVYKSETNFVFAETKHSRDIFLELLKRGVAIRELGGSLRITAGTDEENKILTENLKDIAG